MTLRNKKTYKCQYQAGFALGLSLVFVLAITSLVSTLLLHTAMDSKLSALYVNRADANNRAQAGVNEFIKLARDHALPRSNENPIEQLEKVEGVVAVNTKAALSGQSLLGRYSSCPSQRIASDHHIQCSYYKIQSQIGYGKIKTIQNQPFYTSSSEYISWVVVRRSI